MARGGSEKGNTKTVSSVAHIGVSRDIIRGSISRAPLIKIQEGEFDRAERIIKFIEQLCYVPEGKLQGQPFKLLPFEIEFIKNTYRTRKGRRIVQTGCFSQRYLQCKNH